MNMNVASYLGVSLGLLTALGCGPIEQSLGDVPGGAPASGSSGDSNDGASEGGEPGSQGSGGQSGSLGMGGKAATPEPTSNCETACVEEIFNGRASSCKLCHTSKPTAQGGLQSAGLDLESPNAMVRLKDVPAKHTDVPITRPTPTCPTGDKLIDSANPEESWLLLKLRGQQGTCGDPQPPPPNELPPAEMACMETYIYCVAGQVPPE
jgi:hypothetical protein